MARPRKPTAMLELSGAFKINPNRRRPAEPRPSGPLGEAPGRLSPNELAYWQELVSIAPPGVLTMSDRWAVELAACLMEKMRRKNSAEVILELASVGELDPEEIKAMVKAESITSAEIATLRNLLGSLGMTPADRSKLSVATEKPKNKFEELADEAKGFEARPN